MSTLDLFGLVLVFLVLVIVAAVAWAAGAAHGETVGRNQWAKPMTKRQRDKAVAWMNGNILLLEAKLSEYEKDKWPESVEYTQELIDAIEATTVFLLNLPENE